MRVDQEVRSEPEAGGVRVVAVDSRRGRRHVIRRLLELCLEPALGGPLAARAALVST